MKKRILTINNRIPVKVDNVEDISTLTSNEILVQQDQNNKDLIYLKQINSQGELETVSTTDKIQKDTEILRVLKRKLKFFGSNDSEYGNVVHNLVHELGETKLQVAIDLNSKYPIYINNVGLMDNSWTATAVVENSEDLSPLKGKLILEVWDQYHQKNIVNINLFPYLIWEGPLKQIDPNYNIIGFGLPHHIIIYQDGKYEIINPIEYKSTGPIDKKLIIHNDNNDYIEIKYGEVRNGSIIKMNPRFWGRPYEKIDRGDGGYTFYTYQAKQDYRYKYGQYVSDSKGATTSAIISSR